MNATKAQTWKLFTLTKVDYRGKISYEEADRLIREHERGEQLRKLNYRDIWRKALDAGKAALAATTPAPMVVQQHASPFDDNSKVVKEYFVPDGVCGFAWVWLPYKNENRKFINEVKKFDSQLKKDSYRGGYQYWVWDGNQSMQKKEAFAYAMAKVLNEAGFNAYPGSRMD